MTINNTFDLKKALRDGPYAWPGGYPVYFIVSDGEALSFETVKKHFRNVYRSVRDRDSDGWRVVVSEINWEDPDLYDAHTSKKIESAYAG